MRNVLLCFLTNAKYLVIFSLIFYLTRKFFYLAAQAIFCTVFSEENQALPIGQVIGQEIAC